MNCLHNAQIALRDAGLACRIRRSVLRSHCRHFSLISKQQPLSNRPPLTTGTALGSLGVPEWSIVNVIDHYRLATHRVQRRSIDIGATNAYGSRCTRSRHCDVDSVTVGRLVPGKFSSMLVRIESERGDCVRSFTF